MGHVEVKKLPRGFFNFYGWITIGQVNSGDNGIVEVSLNGLNGWKLTCNLIECNLVYHAEIQGHPIEGFTSIRLRIQFQWLCVCVWEGDICVSVSGGRGIYVCL